MGETIMEGVAKYWKAITVIIVIIAAVLTWQGLPARVSALEANDKSQDSRLDRVETKIDVQFKNISEALQRIEAKVDRR